VVDKDLLQVMFVFLWCMGNIKGVFGLWSDS
jgi:hypothetical protein